MICTRLGASLIFLIWRAELSAAREVSIDVLFNLLVRDKSRELCELLSDPNLLQQEREFARQTREKLQIGISNGVQSMGSNTMPIPSVSAGSAGPASGKYGGFGSEDIAKLGYGKEG